VVVSFYRKHKEYSMFLFDKKTRNVIKWIWAVFAVMIAFTMIFAFSGFTQLTGPTQQSSAPLELTPEQLAALQEQAPTGTTTEDEWSTSSPEIQELLKSIEEDMKNDTPDDTPPEPDVPQLDFSI